MSFLHLKYRRKSRGDKILSNKIILEIMLSVSVCRKKMKRGEKFSDEQILQIRSFLYHLAQLELDEFYFKSH